MEKVIRYPNGLRLIVENIPALRAVSAGIWVATGSAKENSANNGISHFTEHMLFKGTDKLCAFEIADKFEAMGANINAFTSKEVTCYYFKAIDEYAADCFSMLSHIFFDSTFPEDELDKERKVILEEINMVEDSPEDICFDLMSDSLYGDTSLGRTILGPADNVRRFKKADIDKYMGENYCADNIVISIAGNVTLKQADKLVQKYVMPKICDKAKNKQALENIEVKRSHKERIKDFEQSNIAVSIPSLPFNDPLSMRQAVLNTILGGAMSSRLFQRVREELGLAYSIYSSPSAYTNNGSFNIVVNISVQNTEQTLNAIVEEVKRMNESGISEDELKKAKTQLKSASIFSQENVQSIMTSNGKLLAVGDEVYDIDKRIKQIDDVKSSDVIEFSRNLFSKDNICSAYVGKKHGVDINGLLKF